MLSFIWGSLSTVQKVLSHFLFRALGYFSLISSPLIRNYSFTGKKKPNDLECNTSDVSPATSVCETYTIRLQPQHDLELVGVGASGLVYNVGNHVVLKTSQIFERPSGDAPQSDRWHYASDTLFHFSLLRDERTVLRLLQERPHPHIIEAIDTDQPEGVYLRKYRPLSANAASAQSRRIEWYCDLMDALRHLHSFGIVHADLRVDNILLDDQDSPTLCDFSAASPCGHPNLVFSDLPLPVNGPSPTLSEASDMFAMASFIFHMEHRVSPELSFKDESLILPKIRSGNQGIDEVILKAWLGQYERTSEVLHHLRSISAQVNQSPENARGLPQTRDVLRNQIKRWRQTRESKFGCVLAGILSEDELKELADSHGLEMDAESRFLHYRMPF